MGRRLREREKFKASLSLTAERMAWRSPLDIAAYSASEI